MLESLTESAKLFVENYGLVGLGILSFLEAFIQPVPIALVLGAGVSVGLPFWPAVIITYITNVAGAIVGYFLGKKLGYKVCVKLFGEKKMKRVETFFEKWEVFGVFLAAITPIPFKVATWAAGILEMRFWAFFWTGAIGRAIHFALYVTLITYGIQFLDFLV